MKYLVSITIFLALSIVGISTVSVPTHLHAKTTVEDVIISLPKKIADAVPFFVKVSTPRMAKVSVLWLGKTRELSQEYSGKFYVAIGLLALPVDTPKGNHQITIFVNGKPYKYTLTSTKRTYKTQSLNVAQSYVVPPKAEMERINKDKAERSIIFATVTKKRYWQEMNWVRPANGLLTSPFGARRIYNGQSRNPHQALDFRGGIGEPIYAVSAGKVIFAGNQYFTGNTIYIDHGEGIISGYSHLSKISVSKGQMVKAGQRIGDIGATGRVTGPHLHLTMYSYGVAFDPTTLLLPQGK